MPKHEHEPAHEHEHEAQHEPAHEHEHEASTSAALVPTSLPGSAARTRQTTAALAHLLGTADLGHLAPSAVLAIAAEGRRMVALLLVRVEQVIPVASPAEVASLLKVVHTLARLDAGQSTSNVLHAAAAPDEVRRARIEALLAGRSSGNPPVTVRPPRL